MPKHLQPRMVGWLWLLLTASALHGPASGQFSSITIDDQPTAEQRLSEVNDLRKAGRYEDAAELVQELVERSRFKLIGSGERKYIDAERWVRRELSRDPQLLVAYRERFTAAAEREVGKAIESGDTNQLREAYRLYAMTRPGLEAGLMLSGILLESGDAPAAFALASELREHPDVDLHRKEVLLVFGSAAALMGDQAVVEDTVEQLKTAGHASAAASLASLAESVQDPISGWSRRVVSNGPDPEGLNAPLWSEPMAWRGVELSTVRQQIDDLRVLPIASRDVIFVNTIYRILAMDRAAGPVLWAYPDSEAEVLASRGRSSRSVWPDARGVSISGGRVFGILGECFGQSTSTRDTVTPNRLVCLDASSGAMLWSRQAGELQDDEPLLYDDRRGDRVNLLQSHFVGSPIATDGQVLVLLRRSSQTGLQTVWVLSFETGEGKLRWVRHLSLAQIETGSNRVTPQMTLAGDTLYITDSVGVVAALDPRSGAYQWLSVLAEDRGRGFNNSIDLQSEGIIAPPVMTRSGLVVALASTKPRLVLLDPEDGTLLQELDQDRRLAGAQYILDAGGDVLVVSSSAVSLWDGDKAETIWSTPTSRTPRGVGDVSERYAIIPSVSGSQIFSIDTGQVVKQLEEMVGNVALQEEEVLVSGDGQLHSYMTWNQAYDRLVERINQRPNDPDAGLALASLALRQGGRRDAVMQGVEYAMASVDRLTGEFARAASERVFNRIRGLAGGDREADADLRLELYDQLALASRSAEQEVAYHLDFGQYLVSIGKPRQAVEHFQAVMVDPTFASQSYQTQGANHPAGAIARRHLTRLVEEHGRAVYVRFDALAWQQLETLKTKSDASPEAFAQIAQRYPLSEAASPALLAAAALLADRGELFGELSYCQRAVARAINAQQRDRALGAMLQVHIRKADRGDAEHVLQWVGRRFPQSTPLRDGVATSLEDWSDLIADLAQQRSVQADLSGPFTSAIRLQGRLLEAAPGLDPGQFPGDRIYTYEDGSVRRIDLLEGRPQKRWEASLKGQQAYLVADNNDQLLIWSVDAQELTALHAETGKPIWDRSASLAHLDTAALKQWPVAEDALPHIAVSQTVVCFADQQGNVTAIDRYLGTQLWTIRSGLTQTTAIAAKGWTLAVAGITGPERALQNGRVILLDMLTGESRTDQIDLHVGFPPQFIGLTSDQVIAVGGQQSAAYSLEQGVEVWRYSLGDRQATGRCGLTDTLLAIEDDEGLIHAINIENGCELLGWHDLGTTDGDVIRSAKSETTFVTVDDQIYLRSPRATARLEGSGGGLAWQGWPSDRGQKFFGPVVSQSSVIVLASSAENGPVPDRILPQARQVQFELLSFDRRGGRLESRTPIGPLDAQPNPLGMRLVQQGVVLPMGPETLLLMADKTDAPDDQPR